MEAAIVMASAVVLQLVAAILAIRLIQVTGRYLGWLMIAAAIYLMTVRSCLTLVGVITGDEPLPDRILPELVAFVVSAVLVVGLARIRGLLLASKDTQRALNESEERYRNLFENAQIGIYRTTADGRILVANPALVRMLGFSSFHELAKRDLDMEGFGPTDNRDDFKDKVERPGGILGLEATWVTKDGSAIEVRESAIAVRNEFGKVLYYEGTVEDISRRLKAEEAVRSANQRLDVLFRTSPVAIVTTDEDGNVGMWNPAAEKLLGWTADEVIGRPIPFFQAIEPGLEVAAASQELRRVRKDGSPVDITLSATPLLDAQGRPCGNLAVLADNSERKRADEALRQSEERFRKLVELSPDGIVVHEGGKVLFANPATARMIGLASPDDIVGASIMDSVHPDSRPTVLDRIRRMTQLGEIAPPMEERFLRADGTPFDVEVAAAPTLYMGRKAIQVVFRDITERKRAEETVLRQSEMLSTLARISDATLRAPEMDALLQTILGEALRFAGLDKGAIFLKESGGYELRARTGFPPDRVFVLDPAQVVDSTDWQQVNPGRPPAVGFASFLVAAEAGHWASLPLTLPGGLDPEEGEAVGLLVVWTRGPAAPEARAVDSLHLIGGPIAMAIAHAHAFLEASDRRAIFESAMEGIYRCTAHGRVLAANPAMARILGYPSETDLVAAVTDVAHSFHADPARRNEFLDSLQRQGVVMGFEYEARRKDGRVVWLSENARATRNEHGRVVSYQGLVVDVTRRRELEQQLLHAQKMEAVGRLAGGVAHDFNNLLTALLGYANLLQDRLPTGDPLRTYVDEIAKAGTRAASLTSQLLLFSRRQALRPQELDLNHVVTEIETLLRRLIGEDIDLRTRLAKNLGLVRADPGQVEQVIINLAVNARDAMPNGGKLTILTANVDLDETFVKEHVGAVPGPYVMVSVRDTGKGMDAEVRSHLFEPFFTTKDPGKGTGLGLATAYGIVKQSGGNIFAYSEPGRGSTFQFYLPRVTRCTQPAPMSPIPKSGLEGTETILLVEDEDAVRKLARTVLERFGYRIHEAPNPTAALEIVRRLTGPLDLLLTDMVMPGMSGRELADRLLKAQPGLRVVFMSGYTESGPAKDGVLASGQAFVEKPFSPVRLVRAIRDLLDQGASEGR
jgi:PAS domain S-box-containing protein